MMQFILCLFAVIPVRNIVIRTDRLVPDFPRGFKQQMTQDSLISFYDVRR